MGHKSEPLICPECNKEVDPSRKISDKRAVCEAGHRFRLVQIEGAPVQKLKFRSKIK